MIRAFLDFSLRSFHKLLAHKLSPYPFSTSSFANSSLTLSRSAPTDLLCKYSDLALLLKYFFDVNIQLESESDHSTPT
jgi:hypothetical protein